MHKTHNQPPSPHPPGQEYDKQLPEPLVTARLLEDLVHQAPTVVLGSTMLIIVNYIYYKAILPVPFQLGWLALMGLSITLRLRAVRQHKYLVPAAASQTVERQIILGSLFLGIGWGYHACGVGYYASPEQTIVATITAAGVAGSAAATSSASPLSFRLIMFFALVPLSGWFLLSDNATLHFVGLATICYMIVLARAAARIFATLRQSIAASLHNEALVETLKQQSRTDPLTGLLNRRALNQGLDDAWQQRLRDSGAMGVIICDVDFFKQYNDALGHLAGDECLTRVAATLAESIRLTDVVAARYGGEEFAVLIPTCEEPLLAEIAERLRRAIEAEAIPHPNSAVSRFVTISVGASQFSPCPKTQLQELIRFADDALYTAKSAGRNRVHLNSELALTS